MNYTLANQHGSRGPPPPQPGPPPPPANYLPPPGDMRTYAVAPPAQQVMDLHSMSLTEKGWKYELRIEQQPKRARMCGFGDKDRRPITPPPCVQLIITDSNTGKEVDINSIDHSMFVVNVDLWNENGALEVNLVKHSASSPAISTSTPTSYSMLQAQTSVPAYSNILPHQANHQPTPVAYQNGGHYGYPNQPTPPQYQQHQGGGYPHQRPPPPPQPYQNSYSNGHNGYQPNHGYQPGPPGPPGPAMQYPPQHQPQYQYNGHADSRVDYIPAGEVAPRNVSSLLSRPQDNDRPHDLNLHRAPASSTQPTGMFTRNLIGSLAASAFRLTDTQDKIGVWFIMQDLSVRTEGSFRLRFSFVNVGNKQGGQSNGGSIVNTGRAPVLAAVFSDVFQVYSAKRFPGVVESTPLSKCFATQGIKIPIRKDGQNSRANGANANREEDEDDGAYP